MRSSPRIVHIIVRLGTGGAERSLQQLINGTKEAFDHHVICFGQPTELSEQMQRDGIVVSFTDYRLGPFALLQAWRKVRALRPDIVQGWMYYGCALASLLTMRVFTRRQARVIWSIRHNLDDYASEPRRIRIALQLLRTAQPELIIFNSHAGLRSHEFLNYAARDQRVIANGVDTSRFKPDADVRRNVRAMYALDPDTLLIGLVARFHPDKGVTEFLQMAARLGGEIAVPMRFVLVGPAMTKDNPALIKYIDRAGLIESDVLMIGPIQDLSQFMPGLDLLVATSRTEALPNVVLEAMACTVPVVATRVGDLPRILGDAKRLVAPANVEALVNAVGTVARADASARRMLGERDRQRVVENYDLDACLQLYRQTYHDVS